MLWEKLAGHARFFVWNMVALQERLEGGRGLRYTLHVMFLITLGKRAK